MREGRKVRGEQESGDRTNAGVRRGQGALMKGREQEGEGTRYVKDT